MVIRIGRKWLRRMAGFMVCFTVFPGGIGGPVPVPVEPFEVTGASVAYAAERAPATAAAPLEGLIAARLAAEHPRLGEEDRRRIADAVVCEAGARGVDPWLVYAVIEVESEFDLHARGGSGERGLMQILPSTARAVQRRVAPAEPSVTPDELERPEVNIRLGTAYLAEQLQRYGGDEGLALTAYNAGHARGIPSRYARRVLAHYSRHVPASGLAVKEVARDGRRSAV